MKYYLGIDGGGTKTKFVLGRIAESAGDGGPAGVGQIEVVGEHTAPGCHYMQIGFDGLASLIGDGVVAVCENAGERLGSAVLPGDIAFAFAGCAGIGDIDGDQPMIQAALARGFGAASGSDGSGLPFAAGNDLENALAGALEGQPGIVIIAGTGSNCGGRSGGRFEHCGGWHYALGGDEGSAYWIGWNMLKAFSRQSDGRDEKTALYDAVIRELGLKSDDEMVTRVVTEWNLNRRQIAALAPLCDRLANTGDPAAIAIMEAAARELVEFAVVVNNRLNASAEPIPAGQSTVECQAVPEPTLVSGVGGVFKSGPVFTNALTQTLAEHGMKYVPPKHQPDIGALLLAIQHGFNIYKQPYN